MWGRGYWGGGRVYTHRYTVTTRTTCIKMGSDESHFNVSLIVRDKVTRPCPQITAFEGKGYPKRYRTEVLPLANLPPYRWAKPALCSRLRSPLLYLLHADYVQQFYGKRKTWEGLQKKFIDSYFPPSRNNTVLCKVCKRDMSPSASSWKYKYLPCISVSYIEQPNEWPPVH